MEERRDKRNIVYFIISYIINNLASGVLYDTFVNYLQEAQTSIATSFWAFYGYATFISAALLLFVPKIGYKKLLLFCSLSTACAFFGAVCMDFTWALYIATLLALTGVQLHFIMLSPFIACYTEAFEDQEQFFEGVGVDGVYLPFHKANQFLGMQGLDTFIVNDVIKAPNVPQYLEAYRAHLDTIFTV